MTLSAVTSTDAARLASTPVAAADAAATADRFLKLLVTQMKNQDPLNPMDNAQVTSQMAQINTVSGIEKLNATVQGLSTQFTQMQALQGATLVGRNVVLPGNRLDVQGGIGSGRFELTSPADAVKVEVLNGGGHVVDTIVLGAQGAGSHGFGWDASRSAGDTELRFRVVATNGSAQLSATPLMLDRVSAVSTAGNALTLELARSGNVPYADIKSVN